MNEKPNDPQYKLLAKANVIATRPKGPNSLIVNLTDTGEKLLGDINGVHKKSNPDGTTTYIVPLAVRTLVDRRSEVDQATHLGMGATRGNGNRTAWDRSLMPRARSVPKLQHVGSRDLD